MTQPSRRLSARRRLAQPLEADLMLCGGDTVPGWVVDEQDDGLGMVFGAADAERVLAHRDCCIGESHDLWVGTGEDRGRAVPVRLAHVTRVGAPRTCRAGLSFDVRRMESADVMHLLHVWTRLVGASD